MKKIIKEVCLCKLCGAQADKTGSHILPYSLIRKAINVDGKKERGYEYAFGLGAPLPMTYIGQSVLPENPDEINEETDPIRHENFFVEDYIFCTICETRFSTIESYFADKVINKLPKMDVFTSESLTFSIQNIPSEIIHLYFISLFWRVSVSKNFRLKLKPDEEEKLKKILNETLSSDRNELLKKALIDASNIKRFPLVAIYLESPENHTGNIVGITPFPTKPYLIFADEYILVLYFKESQTKAPLPNFYGIPSFVNIKKIINIQEESFIFGKLPLPKYEIVNKNFWEMAAEIQLDRLKNQFSRTVEHFCKKRPTQQMINVYGALLAHNNGEYTQEVLALTMVETLVRFGWKMELE